MGYKRTGNVDKDRFAELVDAARGNRTMSEFAHDCGVNQSTFTRIMQKSNKGASSGGLLMTIAQHADPSSNVTYEMLMEANGYSITDDSGSSIAKAVHYNEMAVRDVLTKELLYRGLEVTLSGTQFRIGKTSKFIPDILIKTDAFGGEQNIWMMEIVAPYRKTTIGSLESTWKRNISQKVFHLISLFTFLGYQGEDIKAPGKFSIVTSEEEVYRLILDEYSDTKVSVKISIILVDIEIGKLKEEKFLPLVDGCVPPNCFNIDIISNHVDNNSADEISIDDDNLTRPEHGSFFFFFDEEE